MGSGVTKWASHACATGFHNVCGASIYCAHYPSQNHHHLPHVVCVAMWSFHLFRSFETKSFYHLCIVFYDEYTLNMSTTTTLAITWQLVYKRHVTRTIIPNSVLRESKNIIRIGDKKSMLEILIMIPSLLLNWLLSFIHHRHHPWNTISFPHVGFVTSLLSCIVSKHYPHKGVFVPFFLPCCFLFAVKSSMLIRVSHHRLTIKPIAALLELSLWHKWKILMLSSIPTQKGKFPRRWVRYICNAAPCCTQQAVKLILPPSPLSSSHHTWTTNSDKSNEFGSSASICLNIKAYHLYKE